MSVREPKFGDSLECVDTGAMFNVLGVMRTHEDDDVWPTLSVMLVCVVGPDDSRDEFGFESKLGDTRHIAGIWRTLQGSYTLLTA